MSDCLFCKFVKNEIEVKKVFEDDLMIIIKDINPQAKNHFLMIPKEHFALLDMMTAAQAANLGKCLATVSTLKDLLELKGGYRLVINQGSDAGQTVHHVHIHILSGQQMQWTPA